MKANVQYNDFKGTVAADISDFLGAQAHDDLEAIGKYLNLNQERFKIVGLSIYGTKKNSISLICVDKERSSPQKEHLVSMSYDTENDKEILATLFKRFHVVLHNKFDDKYPELDYDQEVRFSDFHKSNIDDEDGN